MIPVVVCGIAVVGLLIAERLGWAWARAIAKLPDRGRDDLEGVIDLGGGGRPAERDAEGPLDLDFAAADRSQRPAIPRLPCQPTDPSISSSMRRFISTAYSMGSSRTNGSMKPLTIISRAWSASMPRLCR